MADTHGRLTCFLCRKECENETHFLQHQLTHEKHSENAIGVQKDEEIEVQIKVPKIKCYLCEYAVDKSNDLAEHLARNHENLEIRISNEDQTVIQCEVCDYKCKLNIQMKAKEAY